MSEQEALDLMKQITSTYSHDQIIATFDMSRVRDGIPGGYGVHVLLKAGQRSTIIMRQVEWEGIREAWQWFLKDQAVSSPVKQPRRRYIVDGIAMYIFRNQQGYWLGNYIDAEHKKGKRRYFGKQDPRTQYTVAQEA